MEIEMARPRSFDENELLETVMGAFWRRGYSATTYRGIESISGVGIRSLANAFGEKDELFLTVLARYRGIVSRNLDIMFKSASANAIIRFFDRIASPSDEGDPRRNGCLMVNTVFEIDRPSAALTAEIAQYRDLFRSAFRQSLESDQIPDSEVRADFLIGALWGAFSQIRLTRDPTSAKPISTIVIEVVESWRNLTPLKYPVA
jgi:TetR/AcrR family transcriptional repressor of nem operon